MCDSSAVSLCESNCPVSVYSADLSTVSVFDHLSFFSLVQVVQISKAVYATPASFINKLYIALKKKALAVAFHSSHNYEYYIYSEDVTYSFMARS